MKQHWKPVLTLTLISAFSVMFFWLAIVTLPRWLTISDLQFVANQTYAPGTDTKERLAQDDRTLAALAESRSKFVQVAIGVSVLSTAYLAWGRLNLEKEGSALARDKLALDRQKQIDERLSKATDQLASERSAARLAGISELGRLMREVERTDPVLAHQVSALIAVTAVEVSKLSPRPPAPHTELTSCLRAYDGVSPESTLWLNLQGAVLDGWTLDLPIGLEIDMRTASVKSTTLRGLDSHVVLAGAKRAGLICGPGVVESG